MDYLWTPWRYSYLVPSDSLFVRQLIPPPSMLQGTGGVPIFPNNNYVPYSPYARRHIPFEVAYGTDQNGNGIQIINTTP